MVTDSSLIFSIPDEPEPSYLDAVRDPTFGTWILRIANDVGRPASPLSATWDSVSRHVYSKQQPWNSTGTLLTIRNLGGVTPLILEGQSYQPAHAPCSGYDRWDFRWHPSTNHPNEQINVNSAGTELMWFDVVNCVKTRSWTLPFAANYGIGSGEGNVSADGRYVVVASQTAMVVVDMDPHPPGAPAYPYQRIGPVYAFPPCSLDTAQPDRCLIDDVSISPSGRFIDVKYGEIPATICDTLCDMHRIFEVDSGLVIRPHNMASSSLRCGSFAARPNGWIYPLKHADLALDPFDNSEDVIIGGGRACPGSSLGRVVKVRLRDGKVTSLTNPTNEAGYDHGSARNTDRPGWFYVTYSRDPLFAGRRFWGEVVAVKLDGSGSVQRFGHYHSTQSTYNSQAQAVPSPDGRRVLVASDWDDFCSPVCGSPRVVRDYVIDARDTGPVAVPGGPPSREPLTLGPLHPNPFVSGFVVTISLASAEPAALEVFDVAGRRVLYQEVGALGAGRHELTLGLGATSATGLYLITLSSGRERRTARAILIR